MEWQPIESIPRTGEQVRLRNSQGVEDFGSWYFFEEPGAPFDGWTPEVAEDWTGGLSTDNGLGGYTHWKHIQEPPQ